MKVGTKFISIIFVIIMFTQLASCGKVSKKPNPQQQSNQSGQSNQSSQQSDKGPSELTELENNIEMTIKTLGGPAAQETQQGKQGSSSEQGKNKTNKDQGGSKNKEKGQGKQEDKSRQGGQSGQKGQGQQQSQEPMKKVVPIINKLHYQWNNLLPVAVKKGAKKDLIDNFSKALNSLTTTAIGKNKTNTLMAANHLYSYIPDLYSLFKVKTSPEIKRMRYYSRNVVLNSLTGNWTQADLDVASLKSTWALHKNALSKEQQDVANKLDFSIMELEKVVKERNQPLTDIKGRVVFSNIEALEKTAGGESKKKTQSGSDQSKSQSSGEQSDNEQSGGGQSGGSQSNVYSYIKRLFKK